MKNHMFYHKLRGLRITRIMSRDGDRCCVCGSKLDRRVQDEYSPEYITFEHVIPTSKGGEDKEHNIKLSHKKCNQERGNDDLAATTC